MGVYKGFSPGKNIKPSRMSRDLGHSTITVRSKPGTVSPGVGNRVKTWKKEHIQNITTRKNGEKGEVTVETIISAGAEGESVLLGEEIIQ